MLSTNPQRRRLPGRRQQRSNASSLPTIAFWAIASLLCLTTLCLISYHVSSSEQQHVRVRSAASSGSTATESGASKVQGDADMKNRKLKSRDIAVASAIQIECIISTPHTARSMTEVVVGTFQITVRPDLAPQSSAAFVQLVRSSYYSGVYFHRVVKGFVAQAGINSNYHAQRPPKPQEVEQPDPVLPSKSLSNIRGTVSFAGGNMHLGQIFINLGNNRRLDAESNDDGSTRPFGTVNDAGMELIDKVYTGYKEGSGQVKAVKSGEVASLFPEMSRIEECHVVG